MKRIGIDYRLAALKRGGISRYVKELMREMPQQAPDLEFILFHNKNCDRNPIRLPNVTYVQAGIPFRRFNEQVFFTYFSRKFDLDIFHAPFGAPPRYASCRSVQTIHDVFPLKYPQFFPERTVEQMRDQWVYGAGIASEIITDAEQTAADIKKYLGVPDHKIEVAPLAPAPIFNQSPEKSNVVRVKKKYGLENGFVLTVGTIEPRKNHSLIIKAFSEMVEKEKYRGRLVIAGRWGWKTGEFHKALEECPVSGQIVIAHSPSDQELLALYHAAALFVFAGFDEGFGLPVLEAAACGCPLLVSNRPVFRSLMDDGAEYFDPKNVSELKNKMTEALTCRCRSLKLADMAKQRAKQFSWSRTARETLNVYRKMIGE